MLSDSKFLDRSEHNYCIFGVTIWFTQEQFAKFVRAVMSAPSEGGAVIIPDQWIQRPQEVTEDYYPMTEDAVAREEVIKKTKVVIDADFGWNWSEGMTHMDYENMKVGMLVMDWLVDKATDDDVLFAVRQISID